MKKLLLISSPSGDGAERMTILYGKILETAGYSIEVLLLKLKSMNNTSLLAFIPNHWKKSIYEDRQRYMFLHLFKHIMKTRPDIVFCSDVSYSQPLLLLKKLHLISCKIVIRDNNMPSRHSKTIVKASKWLYPTANGIISQTQEMKEEMKAYYDMKDKSIVVINNPVDKSLIRQKLKENATLDKGSVKYIACGRLDPQKDFITMLKAFQKVLTIQKQAHLYIIGKVGADKEYSNSILNFISDNALSEYVTLLGYQTNPFKYIALADCFVLSSTYEGLPNVMIEAMYLGRPIAATECIPYIPQVVQPGINGYTCEIKNPEALAYCMIKSSAIKGLPLYYDINNSEEKVVNLFNKIAAS